MENKIYETLSKINVNDKTEKKGNLTYLSWAWAWAEAKKAFPSLKRVVYEDINGHNYFQDGKTCWVKVGVEIDGLEYIDYLPVMDARNNSLPLERVTSFDVNKTIQRSTTKALALHGLGLYIYAGEDLPDGEAPAPAPVAQKDVLTITHDGWAKAEKYAKENAKKGVSFIVSMLERKYTMSEIVIAKLNEICKEA